MMRKRGTKYRLTIATVLSMLLEVMVTATIVYAQPPVNDDIANSTVVTGVPFAHGPLDTSAATAAVADAQDCFNNGSTWYTFTPATDIAIEANTIGSDYDTTPAMYVGAPGSLSLIECNNDVPPVVRFDATANTTYYFMVGFCCGNGETGGRTLFFNVQEIPPLLEMTILVMDGNTGTVGLGGCSGCIRPPAAAGVLLQKQPSISYKVDTALTSDSRRPPMSNPSLSKWRHLAAEVMLCSVRWYLRYTLSYRDVEELMQERGLAVDHTTIFHWVQRYAPELDKRCRPLLNATNDSYRVDETYIKINKQWYYLYRAVDATGATIDFMLSATRDAQAAERFFRTALRASHTISPRVITVDKNAAYPPAFETRQQEGTLPGTCLLRQCKYLNNVIEQDHRFVKRRVNPGLWFGAFATAQRTIQGYEAMHMLRKGQFGGMAKGDVLAQNHIINQLFGVAA
jgi:IS6 family transposase